eukprot:snap_masked-scaffold_10-processed-gene-4.36-mRNA-1 protein AED:0.74 eAED:0.82 QI:0/0/0/0.5/1/1/2/0/433
MSKLKSKNSISSWNNSNKNYYPSNFVLPPEVHEIAADERFLGRVTDIYEPEGFSSEFKIDKDVDIRLKKEMNYARTKYFDGYFGNVHLMEYIGEESNQPLLVCKVASYEEDIIARKEKLNYDVKRNFDNFELQEYYNQMYNYERELSVENLAFEGELSEMFKNILDYCPFDAESISKIESFYSIREEEKKSLTKREKLRLTRGCPLTISFYVLSAVLLGLCELNRKGFIHRDIKPANILISTTGIPKISDFGTVINIKIISVDKELAEQEKCRQVGTLGFRPRELLLPECIYDAKVDVYALGVTSLFLFEGSYPFLIHPSFLDFVTGPKSILNNKKEIAYYFQETKFDLGKNEQFRKDLELFKQMEPLLKCLVEVDQEDRKTPEDLLDEELLRPWLNCWNLLSSSTEFVQENISEDFKLARRLILDRVDQVKF